MPRNFEPTLDKNKTLVEVIIATERLKLAKSAGQDEIVAEILKKGGESVYRAVWALCRKVWREEKLPTDWTRGVICPIFKDGDKRDTGNYRGITLLSIVGKVFAQVVNERLVAVL